MAQRRPLSPHLSIYRFGYTMSLSILHRITGGALSVALLLATVLLVSAAAGPEAWDSTRALLPAVVWKILFTPVVIAFVYHLGNGVRHLCWDVGLGFERAQARRSGNLVIAFTVIVGLLALVALWSAGSAA